MERLSEEFELYQGFEPTYKELKLEFTGLHPSARKWF